MRGPGRETCRDDSSESFLPFGMMTKDLLDVVAVVRQKLLDVPPDDCVREVMSKGLGEVHG